MNEESSAYLANSPHVLDKGASDSPDHAEEIIEATSPTIGL
jgi:hypothetical protein